MWRFFRSRCRSNLSTKVRVKFWKLSNFFFVFIYLHFLLFFLWYSSDCLSFWLFIVTVWSMFFRLAISQFFFYCYLHSVLFPYAVIKVDKIHFSWCSRKCIFTSNFFSNSNQKNIRKSPDKYSTNYFFCILRRLVDLPVGKFPSEKFIVIFPSLGKFFEAFLELNRQNKSTRIFFWGKTEKETKHNKTSKLN